MSQCTDAAKIATEMDTRHVSPVTKKAAPELQHIYLHPGGLYASAEPANLSIIVGSCVAVCIFDARLCIGGATHYILPTLDGQGLPSPRYGDVAIAKLLSGMERAGSKKRDLQAHVYGGACMLQAFRVGSSELIGDKNVRLALETLSHERIPIVRQETGGEKARKVSMQTDTGVTSFKLMGT